MIDRELVVLASACGKQALRLQRASWFDVFGDPVFGEPRTSFWDPGLRPLGPRELPPMKVTVPVTWQRARFATPYTPAWLGR